MASVNKVILIGNVGKDPEIRYMQSGEPIANFSLATNEVWNDKSGQRQERTEWHRIVVWGKKAEVVSKYLRKGRQVYVEGRLQTRQWDDKDGNKKYTTEIKADRITLLGGGGGGGGGRSFDKGADRGDRGPSGPGGGQDEPPMEPITDDDIPF